MTFCTAQISGVRSVDEVGRCYQRYIMLTVNLLDPRLFALSGAALREESRRERLTQAERDAEDKSKREAEKIVKAA